MTGKGLNDYDAIFRILAEHGYRGWVSIEDGMNGMDEMAESLAFLRRMSAKYFPERRLRTESGLRWSAAARSGRSTRRPCAISPEAEFVAVCDADLRAPRRSRAQYGVQPFTDVATMLREARAEAVIIGTPHPLHAEPAILAAEAGVHVLVEKPLAATLADCDAMLAAARKPACTLGVISQRRFYEPVLRMKAAIDAGKIGTPALGVVHDVQLARRGLLPLRPVAREVGHRGRRRARQPVAAPARHPAVAHGTGRGGQRLLGEPEPPRRRGGRHGRRACSASAAAGSASIVDERVAEARHLHQGPHPRLERGIGRASRRTAARRSSPACRRSPSRR